MLLTTQAIKLQQGCELFGTARLDSLDSNWLLKAQSIKQNCDRVPILSSMRKAFVDNLRGVSSDAAALVAGMAIGDTSEAFRTNQIEHEKVVAHTLECGLWS